MSEMKRIKTEEDEAFELIEQAQRLREQNKEAPNVVNTKLTGWEVNYLRQLVEYDLDSIAEWVSPEMEDVRKNIKGLRFKLDGLLP
tara:strand:- start:409 stop:666 length:258 start_codon:yes stop_codon:yes gene_type:complete